MTEKFDTIVIGLGAMGAASLYQLAKRSANKRGATVLGIDMFAPPHANGSSHGDTRITRLACGEGEQYTAFARRSHDIWQDIERQTGKRLLVQNGLLVISGAGPRASAHGNPEFLDTTIGAARQNQVPHELLSDRDIRRRFPAFNIADGDRAYFEPQAGFLYPEECVTAQLELAAKSGAAVHTAEKFERFESRQDSVTVVTDRANYRAGHLVIAAGPWLPQLLPQHAKHFTVRRQVLTWFRIGDAGAAEQYRPDVFPVFYWQVPRQQAIYGFPWIGGGEPSIKLATEQYNTQTTPDTAERAVAIDETRAMYADYVADFLPGIGSQCLKSAACLYTCVADSRFIIDRLPDDPRVIVASPCSGHGFKHSAAIGEAIAELATQGTTTRVSLDRFRFPAR